MYLHHGELELMILTSHNLLKELSYRLEQTGFMTADRWNLFNNVLSELLTSYDEVYAEWKEQGFYHPKY